MAQNLQKLWASVLDRPESDIEDNADFFAIGGDSVAAIKLSDLANQEGLSLPAQAIFENPTLEKMREAASSEKNSAMGSQNGPREHGASLIDSWEIISAAIAQCNVSNDDLDDILPSPPFQEELIKASHGLGAWMFQAVFEIAPGSEDRAKRTFSIVRDRNPAFRTRVVQHETGFYQVVTKDRIDWMVFDGSLDVYKNKELARRMCYGDALCRYGLVHDEDKSYIVWTMSHTIYDRFSKMATLEDVLQCFQDPDSFLSKPKRPAFRKFADHIATLDEAAGVNYWKHQLRGLKNHELLFKDNREREYLTSATHSCRRSLSFTPPKGTNVNFDTITQVAWTLAMSNLAQTDDVFYCTFRSCRNLPVAGIQNIIGPLWSMVPVRRKLEKKQKLQQLLKQAQKGTIAGIPYEPFGIKALNQHFGHKRYLQCVLLPQPPQPDFGAAATAKDQFGTEHSLQSIENLWTQTRGHYGLYVMVTPKQDDTLEIWARYDDRFIDAPRVNEILEQYSQMLEKIWESDWNEIVIDELCPHLASSTQKDQGDMADGDTKKTLTHLFRSRSSSDDALIIPGEDDLVLSHSQLHQAISQLQAELAKLGIQQGSAVSIALPNSVELISVFLAATWQRGIAAPLNPGYKQDEFEFYIDDLCSALVVIPKGAYEKEGPAVKAARKYNSAIAECYWTGGKIALDIMEEGKLKDSKDQDTLEADEDDIALVLHTSGTTGRPKAVPLSHTNLMSNIANICRTYELKAEDRTMLIMPLFHVHGLLASFLSPLYSGGTAIVPPRLEPSFWKTFNKHKANWYSATPSMHKLILQFPPPDPLPDIRFIRSCSSQLAPSLYEQLKAKFQAPIVESYAMTEASHLMASNPLPPGEQKPGSVGKPQGIDMLILDAEGNEMEQGKDGEVSIRGPNVTKGYLNNPDANKSSFTKEGFFRTGDQGKFDEDGYLVLTGRLKEIINKGGEKISPVELDNVISRHEAISEIVTFAIDDEAYGQDVGCAVKKAEGKELSDQELKKWIGEKLSAFKVPKKIWFCEDIPKTATGKVQRRLVADAMMKQ